MISVSLTCRIPRRYPINKKTGNQRAIRGTELALINDACARRSKVTIKHGLAQVPLLYFRRRVNFITYTAFASAFSCQTGRISTINTSLELFFNVDDVL